MKITELFKVDEPWNFENENNSVANFNNSSRDLFSIFFFDKVPDIAADLDDLQSVRTFYRRSAEIHGAALIEADIATLDGVRAIRNIIKIRMEPRGIAFIGSYTLAYSDRSFVLKFQSLERDLTGIRETAVMAMTAPPKVDEKTGMIIGWQEDPYDVDYQAPFMRNNADDAKYDATFPEHPLSKVRKYLDELPQCLNIDASIKALTKFVFDTH